MLTKVVVFAGGALAGVLLAGWFDKFLAIKMQDQIKHEDSPYAQGLRPSVPSTIYEDEQIKR